MSPTAETFFCQCIFYVKDKILIIQSNVILQLISIHKDVKEKRCRLNTVTDECLSNRIIFIK